MGIRGNIRTMALPDLLQWASVNRKTGLFRLHRNQLVRGIAFGEGRIVAAHTNDPSLIGHYLLSSGKIRPEAVREVVHEHRKSGKPIEALLQERDLMTVSHFRSELQRKSEDTIYSLFDWIDAEFSFEEQPPDDPLWVTVDTAVDEILLNGLQRLDEMKMIRKVFHSSGIVLELTGQEAPREIANSGTARRIVRSIDGQRTVADVLMSSDAPEFLVLKLLYHLTHKGVAKIVGVRPVDPDGATLLDDSESARQAAPAETHAAASPPASSEDASSEETAPEPTRPPGLDAAMLNSLAEVAKQLEAGIHDAAAAASRHTAPPSKPQGKKPTTRPNPTSPPTPVELQLDAVPVPIHSPEMLAEIELNGDEEYLVSVIDGHETLEGILTLAPFEQGRLLGAIRDLLAKQLIRLDAPA